MIDWAIPVVYARDPSMTICAPPVPAKAAALGSVRSRKPPTREQRPVAVAVWDVDSVFPSLDSALTKMNSSQDHFGFDLVDISAPLDAWDLEHRARDGSPYLWAERVVHRLGGVPLELHVNVLVCITRHWLRSDYYFNLYGWWPDSKGPPVVLFSCAGFNDLAPEGPATDRAIANVIVSTLTGFLSQFDSHEHGAKGCPMAFNRHRALKYIVSEQAFDARCRKKLMSRIPRAFPALEALLRVFAVAGGESS
jgi:hypothetical protein